MIRCGAAARTSETGRVAVIRRCGPAWTSDGIEQAAVTRR